MLNLPGRGIIKDIKIESSSSRNILISGKIISNNTGLQIQGVPIYTGDLTESHNLKLMAISDAEGNFKFWLNVYFRSKTEDVDKYLYVGETSHLLMQYIIPYENVQPTVQPDVNSLREIHAR